MKILSIGTDKNLFYENSEVRQRMIEYGNLVEELHIIMFATQKSEIRSTKSETNSKIKISNNTFVYPTNSGSRWFYVWDAIKIGEEIIGNWKLEIENSLVTAQDPFECGLAGYRIAKKLKLPLQLQIHTDFLSPYFVQHSMLNRLRVRIA
ncbi:hypothetical protein KKB71_01775, partial [Patescibacteria group bacterium]|nr:hypothetical protein [Patescibacteria group bacterium]